MPRRKTKRTRILESISIRITQWMGTPHSLVVHTVLFMSFFLLIFLGINADTVMLILTTALSLEAIYLSLFIQMTVNRNTESLKDVEKDIDEIQEDVEVIEEKHGEDDAQEAEITKALFTSMEDKLESISLNMSTLRSEIENLKSRV